ncbi:hypothetical protein SPRG_20953 [Saprolegnia parasitica CBS 223.65]|uniref:Photolyase/cryptochrome alpha/beta domain-containing protein n=1 Tax=Saprolegnia parasitica (strain CBS 223.65) TaxID=695850 RepID=A0A067C7D3_SAPPC|nr:hypothetical protein SPRG_20953 [Saprolegnia parasitica CBS 223.65]KDO22677.1 hypothetical protein SPRG_20953 [Saprolegnia parasitica CBS 223.65]|eukprot:XP_012206627.1 hypothetical protein SPRG_20953 [Saprolegnia parasitica CBS 223.65]
MKLADFVVNGLKPDRLKWLRGESTANGGRHVLYYMQASLRTRYNYALHAAIKAANTLQQPLHVLFTVDTSAERMSERHMAFLLESLKDVHASLHAQKIPFHAVHCAHASSMTPVEAVAFASANASVVVTDHPYLRHERRRTEAFVAAVKVPVLQVEADVMIPVATISNHEEHNNGTIRPKIKKLMPNYLLPLPPLRYLKPTAVPDTWSPPLTPLDLSASVESLLAAASDVDVSVPRVSTYLGGETHAQATLEVFLRDKLLDYETERNKPEKDATSNLSPYLRYGNISPVDVALRVLATEGPEPAMTLSRNHMIDEMVVRRELAVNFLERAKTHDAYWNACQLDMMATGKMQGYLRQYWGKKILEWSATPEEGHAFAVVQNAKYNLDGYDPNGYAGVAWSFGKHDRVFSERPVYGTVRYMGARRLNDIFDMPAYIALVKQRCADAKLPHAQRNDTPPPAPTEHKKRRPRSRKKKTQTPPSGTAA